MGSMGSCVPVCCCIYGKFARVLRELFCASSSVHDAEAACLTARERNVHVRCSLWHALRDLNLEGRGPVQGSLPRTKKMKTRGAEGKRHRPKSCVVFFGFWGGSSQISAARGTATFPMRVWGFHEDRPRPRADDLPAHL